MPYDGTRAVPFPFALGDRFSDDGAVVANAQLGTVVRDFEAFLFRRLALTVFWNQAPTDRDDEGDAGQSDGQATRREVEHAEALAEGMRAKLSDQQVRRGAGQRRHGTETRCEGQGHEKG